MSYFASRQRLLLGGSALLLLALTVWFPAPADGQRKREMRMVEGAPLYNVLPLDAIPSIDQPQFVSAREAEAFMHPDEPVLGVMVPSVVMSFAEWTRLHPETSVLTKDPGEADASRYEDYVSSSRLGIFGTQAKRDELAPKAVVQGVAVGGQAAALPHDSLRAGAPVDFELDGEELAAVKAGGAVIIYKRQLGGALLDLEPVESERLRDRETGTVWEAATGQGVSGPLAENALEAVPSTPVYWFAWLNFYPRAEVIR